MDRETFLDELLRQDGRGDYMQQLWCAGDACTSTNALFRCRECLVSCLYCESCVLRMHRQMPFHHLEVCRPVPSLYYQINVRTPEMGWHWIQALLSQVLGATDSAWASAWGALSKSGGVCGG
jgi:hypothetical protein